MWFFWGSKAVVKDARAIVDNVDYQLIRSAWDTYVRCSKQNYQDIYKSATPAWFALLSLITYKGRFRRFSKSEVHFLYSLKHISHAYLEIINTLEEHANNEKVGSYIFEIHPELHNLVPEEYDNPQNIVGYMKQIIIEYQKMLEKFTIKYSNRITRAINYVEKQDDEPSELEELN